MNLNESSLLFITSIVIARYMLMSVYNNAINQHYDIKSILVRGWIPTSNIVEGVASIESF